MLSSAVIALAGVDAKSVSVVAAGATATLKERLSDKASDEQRVDNCKVPPERRGAKTRPDCPVAHGPAPRQPG